MELICNFNDYIFIVCATRLLDSNIEAVHPFTVERRINLQIRLEYVQIMYKTISVYHMDIPSEKKIVVIPSWISHII